MEMAAKGSAHAKISSLPPHQHQGHTAAFAPTNQKKPILLLGSNADCGMVGEIPVPQPSARIEFAGKSPAAKALAPAQCGLSPSLMNAAEGEEGLAISPRAMGRWGTGYCLT